MVNKPMENISRIYFDNAASSMPDQDIIAYQYSFSSSFYANQEAVHQLAYNLRKKIDFAEKNVSRILCGEENFVQWGNSGTDIFNLLSGFEGFKKGNIITSPMEHPALNAALRRTGAEIRLVKIKDGQINLDDFKKLIDKNTLLTAFHHIQSETGIIQPLVEIRKIINECSSQCLFMSDTIQSATKIPIPWKEAELDIISISGHKIGASEGAALIFNKNKPILNELNQYFKLCRKKYYTAGRPNPATVLALSHGIAKKMKEQNKNLDRIKTINSLLRKNLAGLKLFNKKNIIFTVPEEKASPYILHFIVPGYQSAVLVRMMSKEKIYFSSGSACQAETNEPSPALTAMNLKKEDAFAGVRLSFSSENTISEAEIFVEKFQKALLDY
jgi:cysteine desulfurase